MRLNIETVDYMFQTNKKISHIDMCNARIYRLLHRLYYWA